LHRLLHRLDEVRALFIRGQPGGVLVGLLALGIVIGGDALIGVVKDAPDHLHPRDLGSSRPWLGLGLGLLGRLPLLRDLFLILFLVYNLLSLFIDMLIFLF